MTLTPPPSKRSAASDNSTLSLEQRVAVAEQRAEIAWKYGLDYKRWCEEAEQRAVLAEQRLQKAKEALWKIGDADYGYTERPHWKLSHEHLYVGEDEASAYARAVLIELDALAPLSPVVGETEDDA